MLDPRMLYPRRLAYRALGIVLEQYGLTAMALKLNPDDPSQALPGHVPSEIWLSEDFRRGAGQVIASVVLEDGRARVLVERVEALIRLNHRRGFVAREVGIDRHPGRPDIDAVIDLAEVVEVEGERMRTAPQRVLPPASRPRRPPTAIRAFGSSR